MTPVRSFEVLGDEPVEILVDAAMTAGQSTTLRQTSPPGGGPPPHWHKNEDETFYVLEGEFEILHSNGERERDMDEAREMLRHTLAYRATRAIENAPAEFAHYTGGTREPVKILAHMGDLFDWALSVAEGPQE